MKWQKAGRNVARWIKYADHFYITARLLYWEKMIKMAVFLGAHSVELYLKSYLIFKTPGYYLASHDLEAIYRECQNLDSYFNDDSLSKYFLKNKGQPLRPEMWQLFPDYLRYPELLDTQNKNRRKTYGTSSGPNSAGTLESLDRIAGYIHTTCPDATNLIKDVINGQGWVNGLGDCQNKEKKINCIFKANNYFYLSETGELIIKN